MRAREIAALLSLAAIWGSAFLLIDVVIDEVEPLTAVAGRLIVAAFVLVPVAWLARSGVPARSVWGAIVFMALFNNVVPFSLITAAQEHIDSSLAAALIGTMPLFVLVITVVFRTEQPGREQVFGLVIGFVGAIVIVGPDITDVTDSSTLSQLAVLGAAFSYAASTVVARQYAHGSPLSLSAAQLVLAAVVMTPIALAFDEPVDAGGLSAKVVLAWIALGAGGSGVAYILFYWLVQRVSATQVAVVSYLIPIVAAFLGWAVLDETIGPNLFVGLALIIVGVMAVNGTLAMLMRGERAEAEAPELGAGS